MLVQRQKHRALYYASLGRGPILKGVWAVIRHGERDSRIIAMQVFESTSPDTISPPRFIFIFSPSHRPSLNFGGTDSPGAG